MNFFFMKSTRQVELYLSGILLARCVLTRGTIGEMNRCTEGLANETKQGRQRVT